MRLRKRRSNAEKLESILAGLATDHSRLVQLEALLAFFKTQASEVQEMARLGAELDAYIDVVRANLKPAQINETLAEKDLTLGDDLLIPALLEPKETGWYY